MDAFAITIHGPDGPANLASMEARYGPLGDTSFGDGKEFYCSVTRGSSETRWFQLHPSFCRLVYGDLQLGPTILARAERDGPFPTVHLSGPGARQMYRLLELGGYGPPRFPVLSPAWIAAIETAARQ